mmetsp:Transcript_25067/g.58171  ORF Transcript_25067/g.58171 Transcript_25067/m.58171 type:complete len:367 (-) Transcript_25067:421-1521(-)
MGVARSSERGPRLLGLAPRLSLALIQPRSQLLQLSLEPIPPRNRVGRTPTRLGKSGLADGLGVGDPRLEAACGVLVFARGGLSGPFCPCRRLLELGDPRLMSHHLPPVRRIRVLSFGFKVVDLLLLAAHRVLELPRALLGRQLGVLQSGLGLLHPSFGGGGARLVPFALPSLLERLGLRGLQPALQILLSLPERRLPRPKGLLVRGRHLVPLQLQVVVTLPDHLGQLALEPLALLPPATCLLVVRPAQRRQLLAPLLHLRLQVRQLLGHPARVIATGGLHLGQIDPGLRQLCLLVVQRVAQLAHRLLELYELGVSLLYQLQVEVEVHLQLLEPAGRLLDGLVPRLEPHREVPNLRRVHVVQLPLFG